MHAPRPHDSPPFPTLPYKRPARLPRSRLQCRPLVVTQAGDGRRDPDRRFLQERAVDGAGGQVGPGDGRVAPVPVVQHRPVMGPEGGPTGLDEVAAEGLPGGRRQARDQAGQVVPGGEAVADEQDVSRGIGRAGVTVRSDMSGRGSARGRSSPPGLGAAVRPPPAPAVALVATPQPVPELNKAPAAAWTHVGWAGGPPEPAARPRAAEPRAGTDFVGAGGDGPCLPMGFTAGECRR